MDTGFHFPRVSNLPNTARANGVSSKLGVQNEILLLNTFDVILNGRVRVSLVL